MEEISGTNLNKTSIYSESQLNPECFKSLFFTLYQVIQSKKGQVALSFNQIMKMSGVAYGGNLNILKHEIIKMYKQIGKVEVVKGSSSKVLFSKVHIDTKKQQVSVILNPKVKDYVQKLIKSLQ